MWHSKIFEFCDRRALACKTIHGVFISKTDSPPLENIGRENQVTNFKPKDAGLMLKMG
jgi:hypothetical protein